MPGILVFNQPSRRITAITRSVVVVTAFFFLSCRNPFFPPTGPPRNSEHLRATPEGILRQLVQSYERRQIWLFEDLFAADGSFRFYIPGIFLDSLNKIPQLSTIEALDTVFLFIQNGDRKYIPLNGTFQYLTLEHEKNIHRTMFSEADEITFINRPVPDLVTYVDTFMYLDSAENITIDTLTGDTSRFTRYISVYDTIRAVLLTTTVTLRITAPRLGSSPVEFATGVQLFALKRDPENRDLWVIETWYEIPNV